MSSEHDSLRRLRDADPVSPEQVRGAARKPGAQAALDRILGEEPKRRAPRRGAFVTAAVLTTVSILVWVAVTRRTPEVELSTAVVVLSEAARTAAGAGPLPLGSDEFVYLRTDQIDHVTSVSDKGVWTALVPRRREVWVTQDGSGRILEVPGRPTFPGPRDRILWRRAGRPRIQGGVSDREYGPGRLLPERVETLPTHPEALAEALLRDRVDSALPPGVGLFVASADLLSEPLVAPTLRAALFRVLAGIGGVEPLGRVRDPSGRAGIGVAITSSSRGTLQRHVLIFDGETSEILAEKVIILERQEGIHADPPIVIESRVYGSSEIVSSLETRAAL